MVDFAWELTNMTLQEMANLVFLALCIWREARGESYLCKIAVGYSILNRVARPTWWGTTIMEVLFKKEQYSSLTHRTDVQLTTWPIEDKSWSECLIAARSVINGIDANPVPGADSYHDISISGIPGVGEDKFVKQIGRIKFYNVDNDYEAAHANQILHS